ncbi:hypothetical protein E1176_02720 [Fulvivirga sp. RKSG066]|nr:hypothetical protein [Fulvivirga aurantia]
MSPNENGLYFHAIDTVLADIKADYSLTKVYLTSQAISFNDYPNQINDLDIVISDVSNSKKISRRMNSNDIWLRVMPISIIRNQLSIVIWAYKKNDKQIVLLDMTGYKVQYELNCPSNTYELIDFEH